MPEFLNAIVSNGPHVSPQDVAVRLVAALALGGVVTWIYRKTRKTTEITGTFPTTLILLCILIAMVTQVIGDNVARAFSLVGALSIVRFRTVVRDTQDTAYVIFAVVIGMAVGAQNIWVALIGLVVVGLAAFLMRGKSVKAPETQHPYMLNLRVGLGNEVEKVLREVLEMHLEAHELISIGTAKQGVSLEMSYETRLRSESSAKDLVKALNRVEGVQSVQLERRVLEQ